MGYTYQLYESISDVDPHEWNALREPGHDPFMDPRFIAAVEKSMAGSSRFWHALVRDDAGRPVASACLCSYRVDATLLAEGGAKKVAAAVQRLAPWLLNFNVVFCGLPVSAGQSHLRFAPDADCRAVLVLLEEAIKAISRKARAKCVVFKEYTPAESARLYALAELGYLRADSLPMNHTPAPFGSFDEYLASLPSRKRYPVKRSQKKFAKSGLRVVQMPGGGGADQVYTDEVHRLYDNVLERAKVKLERLPAEFFRELARQLPDETAFTFIYDDAKIVAFAASLFTPVRYHQMFVGVDYDKNPQVDLYFNLFFQAVDYAYRQHVGEIFCGQSADTFKARKLGCQHLPLSFYVKGADRLSAWVIRKFFNTLFPPRKPELDPEGPL